MRTVIYARYSSQLQNNRSIADQLGVCRERAAREGWTVVAEFQDAAISGAAGIDEAQRPGLNALLATVEAGGIDQVLTDTTSRLARHLGDTIAIRERLEFAGCRLFTLADGEVDDITGTFKGLMDQRFRKDLAHNIRRAQRGRVAEGRAPAGLAYGYKSANRIDERGIPVRGLRAIDDEKAEIVRRIFREYAAGQSPRAIATALNAEGIPGPRGGTWRTSTILGGRKRTDGMLKNRLYRGELVAQRTSKITNPRTRKTVIRPNRESEWAVQQVPELRIIDEPVWLAVQAELESRSGTPFQLQPRPKHLLSGLGRCGVCGRSWVKVNVSQWECSRSRDGACTNRRSITSARYEREVLGRLETELLHPDLVDHYVRTWHRENAKRSAESASRRASIERRHAEADRKVKRLVAFIADGDGDFAEMRTALAAARTDRDRASAELTEIDAPRVVALHTGLADDYRRQVAALAEALAGDEEARRNAMPQLRALVDRIELHPAEGPRGVTVKVFGRLQEILRLAGTPLPVDRVATVSQRA
ncbi:recombinase family protein [Sphingomonas sp. S2-65]|uniref:recombinase family protein n=1 Tax=Sphingomonas sp. S2-65 TaxID=2903960 RepID=UPI001F35119C|nr:recombinase family protein [Sphingomonas sp. S2-65]UYY60134.1 recombinase family protein [Sphingomonas sp. S2-65]